MKVQVKLEYNGQTYLSNNQECSKEEIDQVKKIMKQVSEGKADGISIENGNEEYFFSESILKSSIITVIVSE